MAGGICRTFAEEFPQVTPLPKDGCLLDIKSIAIEASTPPDASFEPYGRLFRMLMPSLRGVIVHDGFANLIWASEDWDLADDREVVNEAISNALADTAEFAGIARFDADRAVYSFAMRGEHIELLGVVSLLARLSGARTEGRPLQYVRQLVQPAWSACAASCPCARSSAHASGISTFANATFL